MAFGASIVRGLAGVFALVGIASSAVSEPARPRSTEAVRPQADAPWSDAWLLGHTATYLDDAQARRAALHASLANHNNIYSRMRLAAYGLGRSGWDVLPAWNPTTRALDSDDVAALESGLRVRVGAAPRLWSGERPSTMQDWTSLGRSVFFRYPLRAEVSAEHAFATGAAASTGLERGPDGSVPGLVAYTDVDGTDRVGITCALCHTAMDGGELVVGRARRSLDYGAMRLAYEHSVGDVDVRLAARMSSWGPGRADITEDDDQDPVAIPDLWRLRELRHLTQAATIVHDSPLALALRQETQMLHANGERVRPPRELAWALAMYLYSLEPPASAPVELDAGRGAELFEAHCRGCHRDANGSGEPVAAGRVGTDRALADGRARGTGKYRPAPLIALADAAPYLHTGDVATVADLLDPARLRPGYARGLHGSGPVPGHRFGTELPAADRVALAAWLQTQ